MKLKEIGVSVLETTSAGSIASVASSLFTPTASGQPAMIRRTRKKKDKDPSIYEGSAKPEYHNTQVKGKDPIPSKSKPTSGHQSSHPFRGKLVGEGDMEADREAGIKWVENPDWKRLHEMDLKMIKDFLDHKESVSEQPAIKAADPTAKFNLMRRDINVGQQSGGTTSAALTTRAFSQIADGKPLPPNLIKAIKPYTDAVQKIMVDPKLFARFRALVKLSNADSADAVPPTSGAVPPKGKALGRKIGEATMQRQHFEVIADIIGSFPGNAKVRMDFMNHAIKELPKYNDQFKDKTFIARVSQAVRAAKEKASQENPGVWDKVKKIGSKTTTDHYGGGRPPGKIQDSKQLEKAPPGREKQVKALKKKFKGDKSAPYAITWSQHNKGKK